MDYSQLFDGEVLDTVAGFYCTYKYIPPLETLDSQASPLPLVVLIPGAANHARIFYGGHSGFDSEDFLTTWLSRAGFPILAISYPLEPKPENNLPNAAGFRLPDWGRQAALVTRKVLKAQSIPTHHPILLACWSMGGRMVLQFTEAAARECDLHIDLIVPLTATQGFGSLRPPRTNIRCTEQGFADFPGMLASFHRQIAQQDARHPDRPPTIPPDIYTTKYYGFTPVNLNGCQVRHDLHPVTGAHSFIPDRHASSDDAIPSKDHSFAHLPWLATITCTSPLDARHVLLDELQWKSWTAQRMTAIWEQQLGPIASKKDENSSSSLWDEFRTFTHKLAAPGVLHRSVEGNHFFFLGRDGARSTADMIVELWRERRKVEGELVRILGGGGGGGGAAH